MVDLLASARVDAAATGVPVVAPFTPRPWQSRCLDAVLAAFAEPTYTPGAISIPTGCGKTMWACWWLWTLDQRGELPARVVIVTSRTMLVADFVATLKRFFPIDRIGRFDGHKKRAGQILLTTYPSLGAALAFAGGADLLICDEAHWSAARRARATIETIPRRLGMSATLYLGRRSRRISAFERTIYRHDFATAIEEGDIVDYDPIWLAGDIRLESEERTLQALIDQVEERGGPAVLGAGLVTASTLADAEAIAGRLRDRGWDARAVGGASPPVYRRAALRAVLDGEPVVLVTVKLLAEGVSLPPLRWLGLVAAMGPGSRVHLAQIVGRVVRTCPGKSRAIVFDPGLQLQVFGLAHKEALGAELLEKIKKLPKDPKRRAVAVVARLDGLPYAQRMGALELWAASIRRVVERAEPTMAAGARRVGPDDLLLPIPVSWWARLDRLVTHRDKAAPWLSLLAGAGDDQRAHAALVRRLVEARAPISRAAALDLGSALAWVQQRWERDCREAWRQAGQAKSYTVYQAAVAQARLRVRCDLPGL